VALDQIKTARGEFYPLKKGMVLEYWLEALDNCDLSEAGGNLAQSKAFKVNIEAAVDGTKQQEERKQAEAEQKKHEQKQDQAQGQENEKRKQERAEKGKSNEQIAKEAAERQKDLEKKADDLRRQDEELQKEIEKQKKQEESKGAAKGDDNKDKGDA